MRYGNVMLLEADFAQKFDLIVANPPYFIDSLRSPDNARDLARSAVQTHFAWLMQAQKWLNEEGKNNIYFAKMMTQKF